ncbi:ring-cleaving dioxygenase [Pontibacillus yanchengensis]|uniref:Ring-cleaving dioxygenase n=1 Tax=Pontibacillus yanchengensis Y32 TaxID=1385514 RepID=A0A0A2T844_9BACI|nr:ring-cleaving dioxygenase [Pontibacillus yanchengensis]KGP71699.1 ring-cleaving dioxygenase [Pontibacillus yanchengensis Y32]
MNLLGIHHVSILTGKAERNFEFYTKILGMRLVKKSVNQDETSTYHLFYGDAKGSPGTELTFFDIPGLGHTYPGVSSITSTSLRVKTTEALEYWQKRFEAYNVEHEEIKKRANRDTLAFQDFEGTQLILVADNGEEGVAAGEAWDETEVPKEYGIVGLGPVLLRVRSSKPTAKVLQDVLGFRYAGSYPSLEGDFPDVEVYTTGEGGAGAEVHIQTRPDLSPEKLGRGGVHHVAFRVPDEDEHAEWVKRIQQTGMMNSGKVDRFYFKALYFREPNGILFELSTDTPGFDIDESVEALGENLSLPPFLEKNREEIEKKLRPLTLDS